MEFLDTSDDLVPEDILLKWFNYHLKQAKHPRTVSNFSSDIKDSENYSVLLHQLAPNACSLDLLEEKDLLKRASLFLESADKIGCKKFINERDIVKGDSRLNTAFVANLFTHFNKPVPEPEPESPAVAIPELDADLPTDLQLNTLAEEIERLQMELKKTQIDAIHQVH